MSKYKEILEIIISQGLSTEEKVIQVFREFDPNKFNEQEIKEIFRVINELDPAFRSRGFTPLMKEIIDKKSKG